MSPYFQTNPRAFLLQIDVNVVVGICKRHEAYDLQFITVLWFTQLGALFQADGTFSVFDGRRGEASKKSSRVHLLRGMLMF